MSLNQELKDFLNGWSAVTKISGSYDDAAYKRARTKYLGSQQGIADEKLKQMMDPERQALEKGLLRSRSNFLDNGGQRGRAIQAPASQEDIAPNAQPVTGPAIDNDIGVKGYDEGGMVEDDDDDDETPMAMASAGSSSSNGLIPEAAYGGLSAQAANDAVHAGTLQNLQQHGLHQPGTALRQPANAQSYLRGRGAAGPMLTQAVLDRVDPKHQLSESQRTMAAYSAVHQYYMQKGEPDKAKKAAAALLQQHRINAGHYNALARAALEGGKIDDAARLATKSYANIPSGKDLQIQNIDGRIVATATDEATGKVISKKILTPQEFGAALMKVQPDDFDRTITEAAGQRYQQQKQPKAAGPKALTLKDRETARNAIPADAEGNDEAQNIAAHIYGSNDGVSPKDALDVAKHLIGAKAGLTMKGLEDGGAEVELHDGRNIRVSRNIRMQIDALRGKTEYDRQVAIGKAQKEDDENTATRGAIKTAQDKRQLDLQPAGLDKRNQYDPGSRVGRERTRKALDEQYGQQPQEEEPKQAIPQH